jgi:hypothetical protein
MALSGTPKPPKTPDSPEKVAGLDVEKIKDIKGIGEIMEHLKKGDWAAMAGAIMTLWKEFFGTPEEKAEIAKAREAAKKEDKAKKKVQGDLGALRTDVDKDKDKEKDAEEEEKPELVKNPEVGDWSDCMFIGDSAAKGMFLSCPKGKRPGFIGKVGFSTFEVLKRLKAERGRLEGKDKAMIYCAGNNILATSTDKLVDHMVEMAQICNQAGVPEIIVNSQFPPIPDYVKNLGKEKFEEVKKRNSALVKALKKAHKEGRFPSGVRVVDLTTPFSDEKGEMKTEFVDPKAEDYLHPWFAYKPALDYMGRTGESKVA